MRDITLQQLNEFVNIDNDKQTLNISFLRSPDSDHVEIRILKMLRDERLADREINYIMLKVSAEGIYV